MKHIFSNKSGIALSAALLASTLAGAPAFADGRADGGGGGTTAPGCCGSSTPSTPGNPGAGDHTQHDSQDLCVVVPKIISNDGTSVVFKGHIERWRNGLSSNATEIDTYNQLIKISVPDLNTMLEKASSARADNFLGIGGDDRRVFRLGWADRNTANPPFIDQACQKFSYLLGEYHASLVPAQPIQPAKMTLAHP